MNNSNAAADALSSRVTEETSFQASILALGAAIESAGKGGEWEEPAGSPPLDRQLHRLLERARPSEGVSESSRPPDLRGFDAIR